MSESLSQQLAAFAYATARSDLPESLLTDAKGRILDVIGNALAARDQPPGQAAERLVLHRGGSWESSIIGHPGRQTPAAAAALVNGTLAHTLDFDDTHLPSVLHPSASIIPAALAAAEAEKCSGMSTLTAAVIGNEICVRLGSASYDAELKNSIFFENGLHATSICGTLGAAMAAGVLMGLGAEQLAHALAIAASMGAGLLEANRTGGSVKPLHCGWAAHSGITAAELARIGVTGPPTVLEGRFGFYRAYSDGRFDADALVGELGERWEVLRTVYKPYPTNHFTHAGIDAALELRAQGVRPEQIIGIELGVPVPVLRTIAEPSERKAEPESPHAAKFSGPFTVAAALIGGGGLGVSDDDFTPETIRDPDRLGLARLVRCYGDDLATAAFPHHFPAVLRATLSDGTVKEHRVERNRGGPGNPLTTDELTTKFELNALRQLDATDAERLADKIWSLESADSVQPLLASTRASIPIDTEHS